MKCQVSIAHGEEDEGMMIRQVQRDSVSKYHGIKTASSSKTNGEAVESSIFRVLY